MINLKSLQYQHRPLESPESFFFKFKTLTGFQKMFKHNVLNKYKNLVQQVFVFRDVKLFGEMLCSCSWEFLDLLAYLFWILSGV